ncbi:hypothetical protein [Rivibacter subsaxonicus]|uniref:Uncharacterized protein n=1 Tax=Rivibacter subsaxonicus TaxID=457575 RepID=A0A4Q7VVN5_9BURK|nr:hypothetical protein [Rivibacter subsaxonicus]RZU00742.1 hypothetical protein EV670_1454 [Rivibacter subsaxonicus]
MEAKFRHLAVATLCAAFGAGPVLAADQASSSCTPLSTVQKRVVEKADQSVDALRNYVYITRGIHQLYMGDIAESLDGWRADARCQQQQKVASATIPKE